jgi:hypothetical protein
VLWAVSAWLSCTAVYFALLPWIPSREFSVKGLILGTALAIPFIVYKFSQIDLTPAQKLMQTAPLALMLTAIISFFTLNQTGTTPLTSWTSVKREIARYVPVQAAMLGLGILLTIIRITGVGK